MSEVLLLNGVYAKNTNNNSSNNKNMLLLGQT